MPPREGETEWSCDQIELAPIALAMWQKGDDAPVLLRWLLALCISTLSDPKAEVCEEARLSVASVIVKFMRIQNDRTDADVLVDDIAEADGVVFTSPALRGFCERFVDLAQGATSAKARRRLKRLRSATAGAEGEAKAKASRKLEKATAEVKWKETTGVLALAAAVSAFPHNLPLVLPTALAQLSLHGSSQNATARECAKTTLRKFKASHSDSWTGLKRFFTVDQLESLEGELFAPSYFA